MIFALHCYFLAGIYHFFADLDRFFVKDTAFFVKTAIKLQKNHKKIQFLLIRGVDKSQTAAYNIRGTLSKTACFTHISDSFTIEL